MGWKTINGNRYYYRSVRDGKRVRTEYWGGGYEGFASVLDEQERLEKQLRRLEVKEEREAWDEIDEALDGLATEAVKQAEGVLNEQGYFKHKRSEWRKRRDNGQTSGPVKPD